MNRGYTNQKWITSSEVFNTKLDDDTYNKIEKDTFNRLIRYNFIFRGEELEIQDIEYLTPDDEFFNSTVDVPLYIGSEEIKTGNTKPLSPPHDHQHIVGKYHLASTKLTLICTFIYASIFHSTL